MRRYKVSLFVREPSCLVSDRIYSFLKLLVEFPTKWFRAKSRKPQNKETTKLGNLKKISNTACTLERISRLKFSNQFEGSKLNSILRIFTKQKDWANTRLVAAHCQKLVDSLAPSGKVKCDKKENKS